MASRPLPVALAEKASLDLDLEEIARVLGGRVCATVMGGRKCEGLRLEGVKSV